MNIRLRIPLVTDAEQFQRLHALQVAFSQVCNVLSPQVAATRCWNRVALHHMAYKALREQFPALGSQMICNAIYSVSRTSRMLYQRAGSPFNLAKLGDRPLPVLQYTEACPVYFDRHTLSIKNGQLSMYTLDGRMRFQIDLRAEDEENFRSMKLREIVLARDLAGQFVLTFWFGSDVETQDISDEAASEAELEIPEYIVIKEAA